MSQVTSIVTAAVIALAGAANGTIIYVDWSGGGDYLTIQEGINAASEGDTVLVAPGTYMGPLNHDLDFGGTNIVLMSEAGEDSTVIDCEDMYRGFHLHTAEDTTSVVRGFTVLHATVGIELDGSSPIFEDCRVQECEDYGATCVESCAFFRHVDFVGSRTGVECWYEPAPTFLGCAFGSDEQYAYRLGLQCIDSSVTVKRCQFIKCVHSILGGAVSCVGGSPVFEDVLIQDCYGLSLMSNRGLGMYLDHSSARLDRVVFKECYENANDGGVLYVVDSAAELTNVVFWGNTVYGSILCVGTSHVELTNVTIANDDSIVLWDSSSATILNSIIAYNHGPPIKCGASATATTSHSCIFANAGGDSLCGNYYENLFTDPLFCDRPEGDLTLRDDSPCLPENNAWGELIGAYGAGGCGTGVEERVPPEGSFKLYPPFPNPAGGPIAIECSVSQEGVPVVLSIFNLNGELVRSLSTVSTRAGRNAVIWDGLDESGRPVASGVYFLKGLAGDETDHGSLVVLR